MNSSDHLADVLAGWTGRVAGPQEQIVLDWAGGRGVPSGALASSAPANRPFVCTAFGGGTTAAAAALLVLWRDGFAPAPLDTRLGAGDLAARLRLVRPSTLLVAEPFRAVVGEALARADLPGVLARVVPDDPGEWDALPRPRAAVSTDPGLVVFTSGTTGAPKAVLLTRANLVACAAGVAAAQRLGATDRVLNPLSLAHVNAPVVALLATALSGGSVVLMRRFEPDLLWRLAVDEGATWVNLVPPLIATLLRHHSPLAREARDGVRFVRSASVALPPSLMTAFEDAFGIPVVESYGISEASSQVTINEPPPGQRRPGSVGRPGQGVELRIADDAGLSVPTGQPGEVLVRGPTVMAGYLDDSDATSAAFSGDWLRTGDLGVLDETGCLRLVGRKKELINRGGEKVPPRMIEEAALEHPEVVDAAAVGVPDETYGEEIKACVVLRPGTTLSVRELQAFLRDRLPVHARPRILEVVDTIPRSPGGKILRRELVQPRLSLSA